MSFEGLFLKGDKGVTSPLEQTLKDVLNIPEDTHAGDFKVELSGGFEAAGARVDEYVVTEQLQDAFRKSLNLVKDAVQKNKSEAAYLHGSFGSGKSHFMTVLHAILQQDETAWKKPKLEEVVADHAHWLRGKKFMMVPYHLVGSTDIGSAILGGYVAAAQRQGLPVPPVYRSDSMLSDAAKQRRFLDDDVKFAAWLGSSQAEADPDDVAPIGGAGSGWTTGSLDRAFSAAPGDPLRDALVSALLTGPFESYAAGARGTKDAFLPLENGLSVMSRHARQHGCQGLILFLDELIVWLQAHLSNQEMVNSEISKLVKLIESGDTDRPVPIVSFISRQRDLSKLVGDDVVGADVKNLEREVQYLAGRFTVINLEDRNLPEIIKQRVLKPKDGADTIIDVAFAGIDSNSATVKDVLLDAQGATHADWSDFRKVYPLSPALLNVLVALSGALQRERTGLKLLSEMLRLRRDDLVGQIIPVGDLWDVLSTGIGEAFTDRLHTEAEAAVRFHARVRVNLIEEYGSADDDRFKADDRLVKTLILAALAPDVSALTRLTGSRLAALNLGSIRSRVTTPGSVVGQRLRRLIGSGFGEIRADGDGDAIFTLHLTDLNIEPLLESVGEQDNLGARRIWVKDQLWKAFGVKDNGAFVCEREVVWRGSRRTAEFVFENVRDPEALRDEQFRPALEGRIRFVVDYPFDVDGQYPSNDVARVERLGFDANTLVWLPDHFSLARSKQLGRLLKINYLLERDRLTDYAGHLSADERMRVQHHLHAQRDSLTSELTNVLRQLYGIGGGDEANVSVEVPGGKHIISLSPELREPQLHGGAGFEYNLLSLADSLYDQIYKKHPDFDTAGNRKAVTLGELKTTLQWITKAMEDGSQRVVVDRERLPLLRRVVHALELGQVHDGPLNVGTEWKRRIEQQAAQSSHSGDFSAEEIRSWIEDLGWTGMDKPVGNLIIATYALLSDRAWVYNGRVESQGPELERIGTGWALRAQPLPTDEVFTTARVRAGTIFGISVPQPLFARNVTLLADQIRERIDSLASPVNGIRNSLDQHAEALGITGSDVPRVRQARHAADLLARLSAAPDATALVRELESVAYDASDQELGAAIASAPDVLRHLDALDWQVLNAVRGFASRGDGIGDRSARLVTDLATVANSGELGRPFSPALITARADSIALLAEAGRQASAVAPPAAPVQPQPEPPAQPVADQVSLTDLGEPSISAKPQPTRIRRVSRQGLRDSLNEVNDDITAYLADHPDIEVEIVWHPVERG